MNPRHDVVQKAKRLLGDTDTIYESLSRERQALGLESFRGRKEPEDAEFENLTGRAISEERTQLVDLGLQGLEKIREKREEEISPEEQVGLEAIIVLEGRPAILIQDGDFMDPPQKWEHLKTARANICSSIQRVGRIEVSGHPSLEWLGTGFLAGANVIVTNRHVAQEFSRNTGGTWTFRTGMGSRIDFREEFGSTESLEFQVVEIIGIHDEYDMALLRVEETSDGSVLPGPLEVSAVEPSTVEGGQVYVIGYPAWDGRRNDPEPMRRIFANIYNVKRLQPGETTGWNSARGQFFYDSSTLGGNSGSPVLDLQTHRVIGLHFGGRYLERNYAVALWSLTDDPLVRAGKLNFT